MKIAVLQFASDARRREYVEALRARLYLAGYEPHQVTDMLRASFISGRKVVYISGTADAERACDVASEIRGVSCKLIDE